VEAGLLARARQMVDQASAHTGQVRLTTGSNPKSVRGLPMGNSMGDARQLRQNSLVST